MKFGVDKDTYPVLKRLSHNSIIKQLYDTFICFQPHINIMAFIRRLRNQNWLFPPTIADLIEEDHICRLVDDVVESIDFKRDVLINHPSKICVEALKGYGPKFYLLLARV